MATSRDSTPAEKKAASDTFAKINWAYETAVTDLENGTSSSWEGSGRTKTSSSSSSSSYEGWTPPHRRTGSYSSSSGPSYSTKDFWKDYMPNYDEEDKKYDKGDDSFGKIFEDLVTGVAGAAAGASRRDSGGIFADFVEFLEDGAGAASSGFTSSSAGGDDADLQFLLQTGTVDEVAEEMDDTDLVVQQLTTKVKQLDQDMINCKADLAGATRYREKMELQESIDEMEARRKVAEGYLVKARKRLLSLQSRYKELIVQGQDDRKARGAASSGSEWDEIRREATTPSSSPRDNFSRKDDNFASNSSTSRSQPGSRSTGSTGTDEAWKDEGFGSFGRRGGGSRSRRRAQQRRQQQDSSSTTDSSYRRESPYSSSRTSSSRENASRRDPRRGSSSNSSASSAPNPNQSNSDFQPPHRRLTNDYDEFSRKQEDAKRMREMKVEEEFDKLKKDLGL